MKTLLMFALLGTATITQAGPCEMTALRDAKSQLGEGTYLQSVTLVSVEPHKKLVLKVVSTTSTGRTQISEIVDVQIGERCEAASIESRDSSEEVTELQFAEDEE